MISVTRFHDISAGHRVYGHESVCAHLHGHNYRISFTMAMNAQFAKPGTALDSLGRVIDFGVIKSKLCVWLDNAWDHRMLIYYKDPFVAQLSAIDPEGICIVPFNPTAENMASYLLNIIGPQELEGLNVQLIDVRVEETRKCSATASKDFILEERS